MKINKAIENEDRGECLSIYFESDEVHHVGDIFSILYKEKKVYFKAIKVFATTEETLLIKASEYGYYGKVFKEVDIRELINMTVKHVTDEETIEQLHKEARYC